ncbi:Asp23/Gls24 family envelope stress response protein [Gordonia sp. OPL2]|nr:Asp23/Gls24 family envelope stress response protein [Gordonia sp. OPL2]
MAARERDDPRASDRGTLTIADRVGEKIAVRAALDVDGVVRHQTALGSMLSGSTPGRAVAGGDHPQATVDMSSAAPWVQMTIAVSWPCRLTEVCWDVRIAVTRELARLTGIRPSRVDVTVAAVLTAADQAAGSGVPAGFVELPPPAPETAGDADDTREERR